MGKISSRMFNLLPSKEEINKAVSHFSKREYFAFLGLVGILCLSTLLILEKINKSFMVDVATEGGSLAEGIVGTPRFVNPVLASSPADQDMVSLVYSGLMRKNKEGLLAPDLALKYEMSEDGLSYTFTLRENIYFHDNKPVTTDDIIFTINTIKDPIFKNPKKGNWDNVDMEKIDEKTIKFTLRQTYASFLENTTLGIMPARIWNTSPVELNEANINPIGSGSYKVEKVGKQSNGIIDYYELEAFKKWSLGRPYINKITLRFYPNEGAQIEALKSGKVDQIGSVSPANAKSLKEENYRVESLTLPRIFGLFFNQSQNQIFTDKNIVRAINLAIDKNKIVEKVLSGYGIMINDPIPANMVNYQKLSVGNDKSREEKLTEAENLLKKDGWEKGEDGFLQKTKTEGKTKITAKIEFSISTGNAPELESSAFLIKEDLEKIGIRVDVKTFEIGNLNQSVIRPRKYDALLFGQIINNESDLFAFWHSSQRKDPGLNVAMYTNAKVDKILENAFTTTDESVRIKKYVEFEDEVGKDMPAIFLYSPDFIYVVSKKISGFSIENIKTPTDRLSNSYLWYIDTDEVWRIFEK